MKISKDRLKQIIKEELAVGVVGEKPMHDSPHGEEEGEHDEMSGGEYLRDQHGYEGEMAKTNLWKIAEYAQEMHDLIHDDEDLEPWVEEKIAVAAYMMDQIGHHLQYMKQRAHEEAEGEHGHVDFPGEEHGEEDEEYELMIGDEYGEEEEQEEEAKC
jgi:hypothetical protein